MHRRSSHLLVRKENKLHYLRLTYLTHLTLSDIALNSRIVDMIQWTRGKNEFTVKSHY
jgi:hypothetical protein